MDGGGGELVGDAHSSLIVTAIDSVFADFPDSVSGFVDLADGLVQDSENAAQVLAQRLNAFLRSHKAPAPMGTPARKSSAAAAGQGTRREGDNGTRRVAGRRAVRSRRRPLAAQENHWRANEYGMTLFLASGLYYVGLRDLAADESDSRKKRDNIPLK